MKEKRIAWIEVIRSFAMLMVVVPHFIAAFCPESFVVWQTHAWLLKGINGKHGLAIFCVLIGYFSSKKSKTNFPTYLIRRYLQFAINIFIVLFLYVLVRSFYGFQFNDMVKMIWDSIGDSVFFRDSLNPVLWCIRDLFFGSLVCWVCSNCCDMKNKKNELLFIVSFCFFMRYVNVWIAICMLGLILRVFEELKISGKLKIVICVLSVLIVPVLYRHEESYWTFFLQGISCCLVMYVCANVSTIPFIKQMPKLRILPFLGSVSFYMFLWHSPVNMLLSSLNVNVENKFGLFAISFLVSMFLSIIQYGLNNRILIPWLKKIQM